ncbi:hypothetical protein ACLB9X_23785 [Streptomyces sp. 5K101]|uniref:hypothetical protein n=1 Tax=Streptomyces sp. 5K101 TaxID=3390037 RepID=UPI003975956B
MTEMTMEEFEAFNAHHHREWTTADAVLHHADESREPLTGTLELHRYSLVFKSVERDITIFRQFLTALDPGDVPGELRFTIVELPWTSITFTPAREEGWIYWADGR